MIYENGCKFINIYSTVNFPNSDECEHAARTISRSSLQWYENWATIAIDPFIFNVEPHGIVLSS